MNRYSSPLFSTFMPQETFLTKLGTFHQLTTISISREREKKKKIEHKPNQTNKMETNLPKLGATILFAIFFMVLTIGIRADQTETTAGSPETSLLCISECGTCPTICTSPPPPETVPSPPYVNLSPPYTYKSPPSPPSQNTPYIYTPSGPGQTKSPPPPPSSNKQGSQTQTPYYYFYTSKATKNGGFVRVWSLCFTVFLGLIVFGQ